MKDQISNFPARLRIAEGKSGRQFPISNNEEDLQRKQRIIRRVIQGLVILGIFLMAIARISPENDIYWQLKIGESIWERHHFPTTDPYNLTNPNAVWTLEEWTVEVIFYVLQKHFGWASLIFLKAAVISLTFCFLIWILNRMRINLYLSLLVFFLAVMVNTRGYWTVFPSIFEYLFVVFAFFLMEQYRAGKWQKFVPIFIPLFSLLWANSHASFFLLEAITFSYVFGTLAFLFLKKRGLVLEPLDGVLNVYQIKRITIASFFGLIAPLASPNFYNTWLYPFIISASKFSTTYVNEYISFPNYIKFFSGSYLVSFSLVLFGSVVLLMLFSRKRVNPIDLLLLFVFSFLAFRAYRHLAIFSLIALPIFVRYASLWFREYRGWLARSMVKDVVAVLVIFSFIFWYKTKHVPFGLSIDMSDFPVKAAEIVNENKIAPNMFNHYNYGGFLIWKMPEYKVFIDGRLEMYLGQAGQDYLTLLEAKPGWEQIVEKYQVNFFLNYGLTPITKELLARDDWKLIYFDEQYVLFVKNSQQNQEVISKYHSKDMAEAYKQTFFDTLAKQSAEEYHTAGVAAIQKGNLNEAVRNFELSVAANPSNMTALLNLAQAYADSRRFEEAYEAYKLALILDPENEIAKQRMERLSLEINLK